MQSKAARFVLGRSRRGWSRTQGYADLGWLTLTQTAVEMSIRMFLKIISNRKPVKIFNSIYDNEKNEVLELTNLQIENMTKLARKSWRIRVLRYANIIPKVFIQMDPQSPNLKSSLKEWVSKNIWKDGDYIFKGKLDPPGIEEWLWMELEAWKERERHDLETEMEMDDL